MKPSIYFFSGPCGCGKSTLADAYARKLIFDGVRNQVYVIHGDDFMNGFIKTEEYEAQLYYVVLTASEETLKQRIADRGDIEITERSLLPKNALDHMPENQGHLFENTWMTVEQELSELDINRFLVGKEQEEGVSR